MYEKSKSQVCDSGVVGEAVNGGDKRQFWLDAGIASAGYPVPAPLEFGHAVFVDVHYSGRCQPVGARGPLAQILWFPSLSASEREVDEGFRASRDAWLPCSLCGRPQIRCDEDSATCAQIRFWKDEREYHTGKQSFLRYQVSKQTSEEIGGKISPDVGNGGVQGVFGF